MNNIRYDVLVRRKSSGAYQTTQPYEYSPGVQQLATGKGSRGFPIGCFHVYSMMTFVLELYYIRDLSSVLERCARKVEGMNGESTHTQNTTRHYY